jgi:flagellar biosynthetic protein FlhB
MAEEQQQQHQEKTEQPTAKRLRDARRRGQIARSRELTMTIVMVAGAILVYLAGSNLVQSIAEIVVRGLSFDARQMIEGPSIAARFAETGLAAVGALVPLFAVLSVAAILGSIALGGWAFSTETIAPKLSKLNPLSGLKRVFGVHGLVEMLKAIGKAAIVTLCALAVFSFVGPRVLALGSAALPSSLVSATQMIAVTFLACSASLSLIALFDVPFQISTHNKKLKMTRREVQDELKETEGRPEVKSRVRAMQQELAGRRMLEAVPEADVVITNPTHYAVALKYDEDSMAAPTVVALGIDHLALRIQQIARESDVLLFESPVLARSLYATSTLDQEIDPRMYVAVAQVLTYVYQLRAAQGHGNAWPSRPDVMITSELAELAKGVPGGEGGDPPEWS